MHYVDVWPHPSRKGWWVLSVGWDWIEISRDWEKLEDRAQTLRNGQGTISESA